MCKLLKVDEVADLLGVTSQTVYLYVTKKRIPYVRVSGKLLRFRKEDIENWIKEKTHNLPKGNGNGDAHND